MLPFFLLLIFASTVTLTASESDPVPAYELLYFNFRARAEVIRYTFKLADVAFTDKRVPRDQWPAIKPAFPLEQLPILKMTDGKGMLQSMAIARYIAREYGLDGNSSWDKAVVDIMCETHTDMVNSAGRVLLATDNTTRAEQLIKLKTLAVNVDKMVRSYKRTGDFLLGDEVTLGDAALTAGAEAMEAVSPGVLKDLHTLQQIMEKFQEVPRIREWIRTRPATQGY